MDGMKHCTACAMELKAEATRCPHCRTRTEPMHRGEGRTLLGVCAAVARELGVDAALVKVAFVVALALSGGMALGVYLLLAAFTPPAAGAQAPVQRLVDWLTSVGGAPVDDGPPRYERRV